MYRGVSLQNQCLICIDSRTEAEGSGKREWNENSNPNVSEYHPSGRIITKQEQYPSLLLKVLLPKQANIKEQRGTIFFINRRKEDVANGFGPSVNSIRCESTRSLDLITSAVKQDEG